jgi:L-ribulokinase
MENKSYVIGFDYGSDSVRALIVDTENGEETASFVHYYTRWSQGKFCDPSKNCFRQHPSDYLEGLEASLAGALKLAPEGTAEKIKAISIDTTGSTPVAVDKDGTVLALKEEFADNPNAMFVLWKDHTAIQEAAEINELAKNWGGEDYTKYCGGVYSSEWFWAKMLHILREDEKVRESAFSWVEHCDWLPAVLTGNTDPLTMKRSRCAAGHKAMWHESFDGLPSEEFLTKLDPLLSGIRDRLFRDTHTSDVPVGTLTDEWAEKLGLSKDVIVGTGAFDAHMGAVGGCIQPYSLIKVMGTSTCDMLIAPMEDVGDKLIRGICGQVDGSIMPGMLGMEAGQSAFGDLYAWYKKLLLWPVENLLDDSEKSSEISGMILRRLDEEAAKRPVGESGIVALDWVNGRRTPDADQSLKSAVAGLSMGSDAVAVYKALAESTAFGARKIIDRFIEEGVEIREVIALGGVAKKSDFVMQTVSDVIGLDIKVVESEQACALGSAMFAAVTAGIYSSIEDAQNAMGSGFCKTYTPNMENHAKYADLYAKYANLGTFMEQYSN